MTFAVKELVTNATAGEEGFESCVAEAAHDAGGVFDEFGSVHAESGSVRRGRGRVKNDGVRGAWLGDGCFARDGELFDAFPQGCAGDAEEFGGADLVAVGDAHGVKGELAFEPR